MATQPISPIGPSSPLSRTPSLLVRAPEPWLSKRDVSRPLNVVIPTKGTTLTSLTTLTPPESGTTSTVPLSRNTSNMSSRSLFPPSPPTSSSSLSFPSYRCLSLLNELNAMEQHLEDTHSLREFPTDNHDYFIDHEKPLGQGKWSKVWGAEASGSMYNPTGPVAPILGAMTPPITPVKSKAVKRIDSAMSGESYDYAIKVPSGRTASIVLTKEAEMLSFLCRQPKLQGHVVPFYGFDRRNSSVVLQALPFSLDTFRQQIAVTLPRDFPGLALHLLEGLSGLHAAGVVHADIKPANILLSDHPPVPIFADFSAAFFVNDPPEAQIAAGTWEFLAPELCTTFPKPPTPSYASDVYALGMTLLHFLINTSPFAAASNAFQMRDMVKKGRPIEYALELAEGEKIFSAIGGRCGFDLIAFLKLGLAKNPGDRCTAEEWAQWLRMALRNDSTF